MGPLLEACQSNRDNWQDLAAITLQKLKEKESLKGHAEEKDIDESETSTSSSSRQPRKKWRQMTEQEEEGEAMIGSDNDEGAMTTDDAEMEHGTMKEGEEMEVG